MIGLVGFIMIVDQIKYSKYPVSDQYWITGLIMIGFIASIITMILV